MKKLLSAMVAGMLLSGCAHETPLNKQTQSGKPEGIYKNETKDKVQSALVSMCNSKGFMVYGADQNSVVCGKQMDGMSGVMAQALIGNAYSTPPIYKTRFTISQINNDTKVWADMWIETQMAMGQLQQMPVDSNDVKNNIQQALDGLSV